MGENASVTASMLGRGCVVGRGAVVEGSLLLDNVRIGAGAVVRNALLCNDVVIGDNAIIQTNCVLGCGVEVGEGMTIDSKARLCGKSPATVSHVRRVAPAPPRLSPVRAASGGFLVRP